MNHLPEVVTAASLLRVLYGVAKMHTLYRKSLHEAAWPLITRWQDSNGFLDPTTKAVVCSQLASKCKAIVIHSPNTEEDEVMFLPVGRMIIPVPTGEKVTLTGSPELACAMFSNSQPLHNLDVVDGGQESERTITTSAELKQLLDEWQIPYNDIVGLPRLVKDVHFADHESVFCLSGPNFFGVSTSKQLLMWWFLLRNRGPFFWTSMGVGLGGSAFLYCL